MLNRSSATDARRAARGHAPERVLTTPASERNYMKCYCACRRHQGCHCIKRRLRYVCVFWAALGQATACPYLMMWGIGCEVQWPVEKLNLRNKRERSRLMCDHRRMLPNMSLWT